MGNYDAKKSLKDPNSGWPSAHPIGHGNTSPLQGYTPRLLFLSKSRENSCPFYGLKKLYSSASLMLLLIVHPNGLYTCENASEILASMVGLSLPLPIEPDSLIQR